VKATTTVSIEPSSTALPRSSSVSMGGSHTTGGIRVSQANLDRGLAVVFNRDVSKEGLNG
jgi:hypothetical protein